MSVNIKISEAFEFISEKNITEEFAYNHKGKYPVFTGATENKGIAYYIDSWETEGECVTFTTYGSAGKLYYRKGKYTIGRNCMGLKLKPEYEDKIILEWFVYKFQNLFYRLRIGEIDGQKSLNQLLLNNVTVKIPDKAEQLTQLSRYKKANQLLYKIDKMIELFSRISNEKIINQDIKYTVEIKEVFEIEGGNSNLTEEFVYTNKPTSTEQAIQILSSSTLARTRMGYIDKCAILSNGNNIKIFTGPCILVSRNGYAGKMTYIPAGDTFTVNDHAYVFSLRDDWRNHVDLRWFINSYQDMFFNIVTSKSDNATFNKEYAEKQIINIPDIKQQEFISNRMALVEKSLFELENIKLKLERLIEHEII